MERKKAGKELWKITADKTALLIIDLELGDKLGKSLRVVRFADNPQEMFRKMNEEMVPAINRLAAACRRVGIPVIFTCSGKNPNLPDKTLSMDMPARGEATPDEVVQDMIYGQQLHPDLVVKPEDKIVRKKRYSAFIQGSSDLEAVLRGLGRDSFIAVGEATDVCLGTTVNDGMMLGFKPLVISDLTATFSAERQRVAVHVLERHFARVLTFAAAMQELTLLAGSQAIK